MVKQHLYPLQSMRKLEANCFKSPATGADSFSMGFYFFPDAPRFGHRFPEAPIGRAGLTEDEGLHPAKIQLPVRQESFLRIGAHDVAGENLIQTLFERWIDMPPLKSGLISGQYDLCC